VTDRPRILVFTGEGKGKTTAALGMALRAAGHGMAACVLQFVKSDASTGEVSGAERLGVEVRQLGLGFVPAATDERFAAHKSAARAALEHARDVIASGAYPLVILDEVCIAVAKGLLGEQAVIDAVLSAPPSACVVLTGRGATAGLIDLADTVTEMRCVKHGLDVGRRAQEGVEM